MTTTSSTPGSRAVGPEPTPRPRGTPRPADVPGAHDVPGDAARRAEFRAFVRHHHPDVGGDPEAFRAGLARWRAAGPGLVDRPPVDVTADPDDPRFDAPIVGVRHVTLHRLGRLGRRLVRRYDPRPGSARVR